MESGSECVRTSGKNGAGGGGEGPGGAGGIRVKNGCRRGGIEAPLPECELFTGALNFDDENFPLETGLEPNAAKKAKISNHKGSTSSSRKAQTLDILSSTSPSKECLPLPAGPRHLFMAMALSCQQILESGSSDMLLALEAMTRALQGKTDLRTATLLAMTDNSLSNLVSRCHLAETNVVMHDFVYMINAIGLASAVQQ